MTIAIVLGNRMNNDGTISDIMRKRLDMALQLYNEKKPDYMILSGGAPNKKAGVTEADAMFDYLTVRGIDPAALIKESRSNVTNQNARNSIALVRELGADSIIVCSSRTHLERRSFNPVKQFKRHIGHSPIRMDIYCD